MIFLPGLQVAVHVEAPRDAQRDAVKLPVDEHPRLHVVAGQKWVCRHSCSERAARPVVTHCQLRRMSIPSGNSVEGTECSQQLMISHRHAFRTFRTPGLLVCAICNSCQWEPAADAWLRRCSKSVPAPLPAAQDRNLSWLGCRVPARLRLCFEVSSDRVPILPSLHGFSLCKGVHSPILLAEQAMLGHLLRHNKQSSAQ